MLYRRNSPNSRRVRSAEKAKEMPEFLDKKKSVKCIFYISLLKGVKGYFALSDDNCSSSAKRLQLTGQNAYIKK